MLRVSGSFRRDASRLRFVSMHRVSGSFRRDASRLRFVERDAKHRVST